MQEIMLPVVEIFDSIEGEGIRTGQPVTFIRLAGCNLRCSYCDTTYAQGPECQLMTLTEVIDKINHRCVTITGGEPLIHDKLYELLDAIKHRDHEINIETNGSIDISKMVNYLNKNNFNYIITLDYKTEGSGMEEEMLVNTEINNHAQLRNFKDVLKFVITDVNEIKDVERVLNSLNSIPQVYISPCFGKVDTIKLVEKVKELDLRFKGRIPIKFQLQLHKIIWNPEERGV